MRLLLILGTQISFVLLTLEVVGTPPSLPVTVAFGIALGLGVEYQEARRTTRQRDRI